MQCKEQKDQIQAVHIKTLFCNKMITILNDYMNYKDVQECHLISNIIEILKNEYSRI